ATGVDPFAMEPGHWLLLIIGTAFFGAGVVSRMAPSNIDHPLPLPLLAFFVSVCVVGICVALFSIALLIAAVYANDQQPRRWRVVFRLIGWTLFISFLGSLLLPAGDLVLIWIPLLMTISPILVPIAMIAAVAIDLWERT